MTPLDDITNRATYQWQQALSKHMVFLTIIVFIATSLYLVLFSDTKPGPSITEKIGGVAYFFLGWLVMALVVSLPLYLFMTKFPRLGGIISLANIALTIFLTRAFYLWLFAEPSVEIDPYVVVCPQPIPEFTLGANSNPSEEEVQRLCACIWARLNSREKEVARAIATGQENDVSALNVRDFASRFGRVVEQCGGMDM